MSIRLDTIPALVGQTDRRTDGRICNNNIVFCMLTRDNKIDLTKRSMNTENSNKNPRFGSEIIGYWMQSGLAVT